MSLRTPYGVRRLIVHLGLMLGLLAAAPAAAQNVHILALGDSLTAGYGLPEGQGFAPQLEATLRRNGIRAFVTDAGVSGDTAAAGQARLAWTLDGLEETPDLAIVVLGGNDMLRGLPPEQTRAALDSILAELKGRNVPVLLAGMLASVNMGPDYRRAFDGLYPELARKHGATFYPFFLEGVAGDRALNLDDGIHPNFRGIKRMVSGIAPHVIAALGQ